MVRKRGAGCESLSDTPNYECQICLNRIEEVPEESDPKVDKKAKRPSRAKKDADLLCWIRQEAKAKAKAAARCIFPRQIFWNTVL